MKKIRIYALLIAMTTAGSSLALAQATKVGEATAETSKREIYGKVESVKGTTFTLRTRSGALVQVDAKPAGEAQRAVNLLVGHAIVATGTVDKKGVLHAEIVQKAKDSPAVWPPDR
jgi:ABC-type sulfate transport system substrate-binding protein